MKKTIEIGTTVWRNIRGIAALVVEDVDSGDPQHQKIPTIGEYKQRFGGTQAQLRHPAGNLEFTFDLHPWSHLSEDTRLLLKWRFIPEHQYRSRIGS